MVTNTGYPYFAIFAFKNIILKLVVGKCCGKFPKLSKLCDFLHILYMYLKLKLTMSSLHSLLIQNISLFLIGLNPPANSG